DETEELVVGAQRVLVETVHKRAAVGRGREPALAVEGDDRLTDRDPADAQALRDVVLVDPITLAQLAVEDERAHVDGDEVTAARAVEERDRREAGVVLG